MADADVVIEAHATKGVEMVRAQTAHVVKAETSAPKTAVVVVVGVAQVNARAVPSVSGLMRRASLSKVVT